MNKKTILKIRKTSLYSVESDILDSRGFYVFRKSGVSTYGGKSHNFFIYEVIIGIVFRTFHVK